MAIISDITTDLGSAAAAEISRSLIEPWIDEAERPAWFLSETIREP